MRTNLFFLLLGMLSFTTIYADDAAPTTNNKGIVFNKQVKQRWRIGASIYAKSTIANFKATLPVPTSWPEQDVKVVNEEASLISRRSSFGNSMVRSRWSSISGDSTPWRRLLHTSHSM